MANPNPRHPATAPLTDAELAGLVDTITAMARRGADGVIELTAALCDIESVSGAEARIADVIEEVLTRFSRPGGADQAAGARSETTDGDHATGGLQIVRHGNTVVARTNDGHPRRVVLAGHIDTVPVAANLPTRLVAGQADAPGDELWGRGTVDMKAGDAVFLALLPAVIATTGRTRDVTWIFYDNEEVAGEYNGLGHLVRDAPELVSGDFAVLGEPSNGGIEGGCNGTIRAVITVSGVAAHSARAWVGSNAIHAAAPILEALAAYQPATVTVDGLDYREGLNAVAISGGIAGNVIPDRCSVTINYRFAPSRTVAEAIAHLHDVFPGYEIVIDDAAAGARPGLDAPLAQEFAAAALAVTGGAPAPKYGWTDVARFSELGIPAVNFGPGDPLLAHKDDERVNTQQILTTYAALATWLGVDGETHHVG